MKDINNILVIGGAGFVGSHLIEKLLNTTDVYTVYIIDNLMRTYSLRNIEHLLNNNLYKNRIKFIHGDINNINYDLIVNPNLIEYVFHLASPRINRINEFHYEGHNTIADGGFKLIDWVSRNTRVKKLYFASSASVYYKPKTFPIKEDDLKDPHTIYGASKLYTEQIIKSYNVLYKLNYAISRFFSVYGIRMDSAGAYTEVIFNWLNSIKNGNKEIEVHGDPDEKILDLIYIDDVVDAVIKMTFHKNNDVYNVSSGVGTTLSELIKIISKVTKKNIKIKVVKEFRTDIEKKRIGCNEKLKRIGWSPTVSVEEGIYKTWEWVKKIK